MSPVVYNGDTNSFSGAGTPNPKLTIPQKDKMDPATLAMALAIEQWCNNVVAPSSSGGYVSLTGPGETTDHGALTQDGPFTVIDTATPAGMIALEEYGSGGIVIAAIQTMLLEVIAGPLSIYLSTGTGVLTIESGSTGGILLTTSLGGVSIQARNCVTGITINAGEGAPAATVSLLTYPNNPNTGGVTASHIGDLCVDTLTPGLWQASATGLGSWVAL